MKPGPSSARTAFTLLELMATGACLAVLIAALPPALEGTRNRARGAQCISNLQRISTASMAYAAQDSNEIAIPAGINEAGGGSSVQARLGNYGYGGKSGVGGPSPSQQFLQSAYGFFAKMGSQHRPLNKLLYKNLKDYADSATAQQRSADTRINAGLYRCPSDNGFQGNHYVEWYNFGSRYLQYRSSYDYFGTSYSAIVFWTGFTGDTCCMRSNSAYLRPISTVPNPANTLIYMENVGRYCWNHHDPAATAYGGPFEDILPDPEYPESLGGPEWHGKGWNFNSVFADGHVATIIMKSYIPVSPYPTDLVGDCAPSMMPPGQERCKWIMIRGRGWQLDTLPASPVESNHNTPAAGLPSQDGVGIMGWPTGG